MFFHKSDTEESIHTEREKDYKKTQTHTHIQQEKLTRT